MLDQLYIIDSTGPFFVKHPRQLINWSKAPHHILEKRGGLPKKRGRKIRSNFEKYISRAASIGYNAVSIDELSRIAPHPGYPTELQKKIRRYRKYYQRLFALARERNMAVLITTDVMFFHPAIERETKGDMGRVAALLARMIEETFETFPEIEGIIFRVGESDGVDVKGDFLSRILLRTPAQANRFLKTMLPVFERHGKTLIFRTWTVGAHEIGDMMWNPRTYDAVFRDIDSDSLVISMKYGEGDFFRHLDLNRLFFRDSRRKIIELQARREYEGFGEFPAFVGFQYEAYRDALYRARGMVGIQVWCQTGGWSRFRNFTFLKNTSYWNELNTHVTLKLFRDRLSLPEAVASFWKSKRKSAPGKKRLERFLEFLRLSDDVIEETLYDPEFAARRLYFNRVRVPPLLHVFWDNVTVTDHLRALYRTFATGDPASLRRAHEALGKIRRMRGISRGLRLPYDHDFYFSTFRLFLACRELMYAPRPAGSVKRLKKRLRRYRRRYPNTYNFRIRVEGKRSYFLVILLKLLVRDRRSYSGLDRLLFNALTARFYLAVFRIMRKKFPGFVNNQGMPIEKILA